MSKEQEVTKAAEKRTAMERERAEDNKASPRAKDNMTPEELQVLKDDAAKMAEAKPQAAAGTPDGKIDIEAMGDVKGDGGDAKDYADDDPDKAKGVPVYEYGLHENRGGENTALPPEHTISARTAAEQSRGADAVKARQGYHDERTAAEVAKDDKKSK